MPQQCAGSLDWTEFDQHSVPVYGMYRKFYDIVPYLAALFRLDRRAIDSGRPFLCTLAMPRWRWSHIVTIDVVWQNFGSGNIGPDSSWPQPIHENLSRTHLATNQPTNYRFVRLSDTTNCAAGHRCHLNAEIRWPNVRYERMNRTLATVERNARIFARCLRVLAPANEVVYRDSLMKRQWMLNFWLVLMLIRPRDWKWLLISEDNMVSKRYENINGFIWLSFGLLTRFDCVNLLAVSRNMFSKFLLSMGILKMQIRKS